MLRWPKRALAAIEKLFEPLQDIDVFVEDVDDEVFYSHLLQRLLEGDVRIVRVFAKGGRSKVIEAARNHLPTGRKALFLVDGDLEWVRGVPAPNTPLIFRLPAYCVENLLISEKPLVRLLLEEATLMEADAAAALQFEMWVRSHEQPLVELFAAFAVAQEFAPTVATVSRGLAKLLTEVAGQPTVDCAKVDVARDEALASAESMVGKTATETRFREILARAYSCSFPLDVVSGKDYLLPLLDMHLRKHGCKLKRKTLRTRLALHCDHDRFLALKEAIKRI